MPFLQLATPSASKAGLSSAARSTQLNYEILHALSTSFSSPCREGQSYRILLLIYIGKLDLPTPTKPDRLEQEVSAGHPLACLQSLEKSLALQK